LVQEGFSDLAWCTGVRLPSSHAGSTERNHARAVALAHRQAIEAHLDDEPLLLLEEDAELEAATQWIQDIPANADALWVGISQYGIPQVQPITPHLSRITRMFSAHAILYLTLRYKQHVIDCIDQCNACHLPFDIGLAFYQKDFHTYALNTPAFYQLNQSGAHNFEALTRGSLLG
jgi:hypothetical protein